MSKIKTPKGLNPAGRQLWRWLVDTCGTHDIEPVEPLAVELCRLSGRLATIREKLAAEDLSLADQGRLTNMEVKLNGAFVRAWRSLGLSDKEAPRPPGRPSESEQRLGPV